MKYTNKISSISLIQVICTIFLFVFSCLASAQTLVQVKVYAEHVGTNIVYVYEVVNNSSNPISAIRVGHRYNDTNQNNLIDERQLTVLPAGLNDLDEGTPLTSKTNPTGWRDEIGAQEENNRFWFGWEIENMEQPGLLARQTLTGFSVTIPKADQSYLAGHFSATFKSGSTSIYSGSMESLDTTPPVLTVTTSPNTIWSPNNKLVPVTVTVNAKDDYDPQPEIKLESITANEPLAATDIVDAKVGTDDRQFSLIAKRDGNNKAGRIYTITYSATDASGNKSTASTTVTVPHDQGK